jgi:hypothetical protein
MNSGIFLIQPDDSLVQMTECEYDSEDLLQGLRSHQPADRRVPLEPALDAANPDYEVERAVSPAMAQFPNRKRLGFSTPWSEEGILFEASNAGTNGRKLSADDENKDRWDGVLVLQAPTPAMENPRLERKWFVKEALKDPDAYEREILARFVEGVGTAFPSALLQRAVADATAEKETRLVDLREDQDPDRALGQLRRQRNFRLEAGHGSRDAFVE